MNNENVAPPRVKNIATPSVIAYMNQEQLFNGRPHQTPAQHCYPTQNDIQAHHVTTITPDNAQLTHSKFPETIVTTRDDHHIFHNQKTY